MGKAHGASARGSGAVVAFQKQRCAFPRKTTKKPGVSVAATFPLRHSTGAMTRIEARAPTSPAVNLRQTIDQLIADDETSKTENQVLVSPPTHSCARTTILETFERARPDPPRLLAPTPTQRAELNNALDKLRATHTSLDAEKSLTAALTAKLSTSSTTFRAIGQTFNAVRRGVEQVSETMADVECRGHGDTTARGDDQGTCDPSVEEVARHVNECVHRDALVKRRATALLGRVKSLAATHKRTRDEHETRVASLQTKIAAREEHIVHLTDLVTANRGVSVVPMALEASLEITGGGGGGGGGLCDSKQKGEEKKENRKRDSPRDAPCPALLDSVAAHRADLFLQRTRDMVATRTACYTEDAAACDRKEQELNTDPTNFWTSKFSRKKQKQNPFPNPNETQKRFADDADLACLVLERDEARLLAERACVAASTSVEKTTRLLDAKNREYQSKLRVRRDAKEAEKAERERAEAEASAGAVLKKSDGEATGDEKSSIETNRTAAVSPVPVPLFSEQSTGPVVTQERLKEKPKPVPASKPSPSPAKKPSPLRLAMRKTVNVFKKNARGLWDSNEENTPDNAGTGPNQSDPFTNNFNSSCES